MILILSVLKKGKELGLEIHRTSMPNDRDELIKLLKRIIIESLLDKAVPCLIIFF